MIKLEEVPIPSLRRDMSLTLEFTTLVNWRRVPSLETCLIKSQRVNWNGHYLMKIMIG